MSKGTELQMKCHKKGSLTIEASLLLPGFLFMMICVISLLSLLLFQLRLKACMHETVKEAAMKSISEGFPNENELSGRILSSVGNAVMKIAPVDGGENGIKISKNNNDEVLIVTASYKTKLYYDFFKLFNKEFTQKCVQHNWEGYENGLRGNTGTLEEEYVYITNDSEVYHRNRECSHIRLKISMISEEGLPSARNSDGCKYKKCEHCQGNTSDGNYYITKDGDRFHTSLSCSGLKRTVIAIPISEVNGRRPCSRCGGL